MLSPQMLVMLRVYWREARPAHWLFPGHDESRRLEASLLQWACRNARATAKLGKPRATTLSCGESIQVFARSPALNVKVVGSACEGY
jgi:integrase/recombinase XerD